MYSVRFGSYEHRNGGTDIVIESSEKKTRSRFSIVLDSENYVTEYYKYNKSHKNM